MSDEPTDDEILQDFEAAYARGEKGALMGAIWFCVSSYVNVPDWARMALLTTISRGDFDSWDEVFGKPYPAGRQRRGVQTENRLYTVHACVLRYSEQGVPIDDDLFDRVGRELGVGGKTTVKTLYGRVERAYRRVQAERQNRD